MAARRHTVSGPGGRALSVLEDGAREGAPVLVHHGTPGSGGLYPAWVDDAAARGLRLIAYDRPGYGGSDRHAGRRVADAAADVAAIADALELDRIATWGVSGGGPHALACAALLGDRVAAAATLASVAPVDADGLDFTAGMGEDNVTEFSAALEGAEALQPLLERFAAGLRGGSAEQMTVELRSILSDGDVAVLSDAFGAFMMEWVRGGVAERVDGWLDDDLAFAAPWGFEPGDVAVPLMLWQGREDRMVPFAHGEWLVERIAGVEAHLTAEDGHLTLLTERVRDVHAWLAKRL